MKKKTVNHSTMLNLKGFLILIAFGIWVYVISNIDEEIALTKEAISTYGGNTLVIISVAYVILVILGLFIETKSTDRFS